MPITITTSMLLPLMAAATSAASLHPAGNAVRFVCPASEELTVQPRSSGVQVRLGERTYDLERKQSNLGDKYISPTAALIIDGSSAVFVAEDRLDLGTCVKGTSEASLR